MNTIQEKMRWELSDESLFQKANSYGQEYLKTVVQRHVYPSEQALEQISIFEEPMPKQHGNAHEILQTLADFGGPATVAQMGGRYYGFVNGGVVPAGLAAKNLAIYWDQNSAMQVISPIAARLESVVQNWLIELFGLPTACVAGFVSGTSMANFCALAAARYRILMNKGWDISEKGLFNAPPIRVVTGRDAHSSILKAISLVGLGKGNIEWVDVDDQGRIVPEDIPPLDDSTILILQAGNVNSGSFDPFDKICAKARSEQAWIHIDGAFGLWAGATNRLNHLTAGYEHADSWAVDGHKTLNTPYDSGIILCRDADALTSALHMSGGYIIRGQERDGMFFTPEMSRRARIIELWATLKYLGKTGVDEMIHGFHARAQQFADILRSHPGFEVLNDVVFNQVLVKCKTDQMTEQVIKEIQELRTCWVGGSTWKGNKVIRISICNWITSEHDIDMSAQSFFEAYERVRN